jgi:hypothetical protein
MLTLDGTAGVTGPATKVIVGTTTNDDAVAGYAGEYTSSTIALGSRVSLTTGTAANVTSLSLSAGDWDVRGIVKFTGGGTTNVVYAQGQSGTTSATVNVDPALITDWSFGVAGLVAFAANDFGAPIVTQRYSFASTTTVYLIARASFTVSTCQAHGSISARRIR